MRAIRHRRTKRLIYAGVAVVASAVPATAVALTAGSPSPSRSPRVRLAHIASVTPRVVLVTRPSHHTVRHHSVRATRPNRHILLVTRRSHWTLRTGPRRGCTHFFTVATAKGAARRAYSGTGTVTRHSLKVLAHIEGCQWDPAAKRSLRGYDRRQVRMHHDRVAAAAARRRAAAARARAAAAARARAAAAARARAAAAARAKAAAAAAAAEPTATTASAGSPLPECTWLPESGGDPTAVNPSSGAGGYYQILPSTWAAYGGAGLPEDAPLAEQTAIAEKIWATQGPSAWVNC